MTTAATANSMQPAAASPQVSTLTAVPAGTAEAVIHGFEALGAIIAEYARAKGFAIESDGDLRDRLLHLFTEVGELAEALRCGNPPSPNIPAFSHAEEEMADIAMLLCLIMQATGARIGAALMAKLEACATARAFRHGKRW